MSDLTDLFAQDPLTYTKEKGELSQIISEFRQRRKQFNIGNLKAGSTKPLTAKQKDLAKLDLGEIDL